MINFAKRNKQAECRGGEISALGRRMSMVSDKTIGKTDASLQYSTIAVNIFVINSRNWVPESVSKSCLACGIEKPR